jgi:hypothetical protein
MWGSCFNLFASESLIISKQFNKDLPVWENAMNKSAKSPLWLRLLPGILLISIPIVWWIYGFMEHWGDDPDSSHYFFTLGLLLIITCIILSTMISLFPFIGGIISLSLLLIFWVPDIPVYFQDIYIYSMLFLAGITGIYVGIWNFRYRRHSNSSANFQNCSYNKS